MKIQFVANDGQVFDDAQKCMEYETGLAVIEKQYETFNRYGAPTTDPDCAYFLHIKGECGAKQFIDACAESSSDDGRISADADFNKKDTYGLDIYHDSWFFFDEGEGEYIYLQDEFFDAVSKLPVFRTGLKNTDDKS